MKSATHTRRAEVGSSAELAAGRLSRKRLFDLAEESIAAATHANLISNSNTNIGDLIVYHAANLAGFRPSCNQSG